jgi:hypothetical protein
MLRKAPERVRWALASTKIETHRETMRRIAGAG